MPESYKKKWTERKDYSLEDDIKKYVSNADEVWYWYFSGCYEGGGMLVARLGNQYTFKDLSHCSCYGPFDPADAFDWNHKEGTPYKQLFNESDFNQSLDELLKGGTSEWQQDVSFMFK